jgi:hypothetical protein
MGNEQQMRRGGLKNAMFEVDVQVDFYKMGFLSLFIVIFTSSILGIITHIQYPRFLIHCRHMINRTSAFGKCRYLIMLLRRSSVRYYLSF